MSLAFATPRVIRLRTNNMDYMLEFSHPLHATYHYYSCMLEFMLAQSPRKVFLHELHTTFDVRGVTAEIIDGLDVIKIPNGHTHIKYSANAGGLLVAEVLMLREYTIYQYMIDYIPHFNNSGKVWTAFCDGKYYMCSKKISTEVPQHHLEEYKRIIDLRQYSYDIACCLCDVDRPMFISINKH